MQIGMIGLGRMGANMVIRLMRAEHACVVYDRNAQEVTNLEKQGATGAASLKEFISELEEPHVIWMMLPAAVVDTTLKELMPLLQAEDIIIDGGNSYYHDDIRRAAELEKLVRHDGAHEVQAHVFCPRIAASVPVESGERGLAARFQVGAEYVLRAARERSGECCRPG